MGRAIVCLVWAMTVAAAPGEAQTCRGASPRINKPGFRPQQTIAFSIAPSADGEAFPADTLACVWRAFQAWNDANASTLLGVTFVPGPGGIVVRYDHERTVLPDRAAAAWREEGRAADGALERADIWLTPDRSLLDSCDGVTKVVLHELGHLHGLADEVGHRGLTVMNHPLEKNDRSGRMPLAPTACDAAQAVAASQIVGAAATDARVQAWVSVPRLASAARR